MGYRHSLPISAISSRSPSLFFLQSFSSYFRSFFTDQYVCSLETLIIWLFLSLSLPVSFSSTVIFLLSHFLNLPLCPFGSCAFRDAGHILFSIRPPLLNPRCLVFFVALSIRIWDPLTQYSTLPDITISGRSCLPGSLAKPWKSQLPSRPGY
jgi:hypothetical protein